MAITLAPKSSSDASLIDGIRRGELSSATRLWTRHWSTALTAAGEHVEPREVPGLAAEAMIGTIAMTATGQGPVADVPDFVTEAVHELGEDEVAPPGATSEVTEVYASPRLRDSFAELPPGAQQALRDWADGGPSDDAAQYALTVLQSTYLTQHLADAPSQACRPCHVALMGAIEDEAGSGFDPENWLHMSTCAWCTEAFHELAFSNIALGILVLNPVIAPVVAPVVPEEPTHRAGVHAVLRGGRSQILTAAAFTAVVAVIGVILSQTLVENDDAGPKPTAATSTEPSPADFVTGGTDANSLGLLPQPSEESTAAPTDAPSTAFSVAPPAPAAPTSAIPSVTTATSPASSPTARPTKKPSKSPSASSNPTRDPDPTPTADPTPSCNDLQHLLAIC